MGLKMCIFVGHRRDYAFEKHFCNRVDEKKERAVGYAGMAILYLLFRYCITIMKYVILYVFFLCIVR